MRKFELLRDLPNAKSGAIYRQTEDKLNYANYDLLSNRSWDVSYPAEYIENNPEWFKEIVEEEPFVWTDELVLEYAMMVSTSSHPYLYNIEHWKKFKASKQQSPIANDVLKFKEPDKDSYDGEKYTEEDLKKAFESSRERNITGDRHDDKGHPFYKYRSFEEYLKLLK